MKSSHSSRDSREADCFLREDFCRNLRTKSGGRERGTEMRIERYEMKKKISELVDYGACKFVSSSVGNVRQIHDHTCEV